MAPVTGLYMSHLTELGVPCGQSSTDMPPRWGWFRFVGAFGYRHVAPLGLVLRFVGTFGYRHGAPLGLVPLGWYIQLQTCRPAGAGSAWLVHSATDMSPRWGWFRFVGTFGYRHGAPLGWTWCCGDGGRSRGTILRFREKIYDKPGILAL